MPSSLMVTTSLNSKPHQGLGFTFPISHLLKTRSFLPDSKSKSRLPCHSCGERILPSVMETVLMFGSKSFQPQDVKSELTHGTIRFGNIQHSTWRQKTRSCQASIPPLFITYSADVRFQNPFRDLFFALNNNKFNKSWLKLQTSSTGSFWNVIGSNYWGKLSSRGVLYLLVV